MKSDSDVRRDVEAELKWSPEIDQTDIAVKVNDGVVALSGYLPLHAGLTLDARRLAGNA